MYNKSFIVDLDGQMFKTDKSLPSTKGRQLLICSCGHNHFLSGKIKRTVVTYQGETVEDLDGVPNITCAKCEKNFPELEKPILLEPNKQQLLSIGYCMFNINNENITSLKRKRTYVSYSSQLKKLINESFDDEILFNTSSKKIELYIHPFEFKGTNLTPIDTNTKKKNIQNIVTLKTINDINLFFEFATNVDYEGLEQAFMFLKNIDFLIKDLNKIKEQSFIGEFYDSFQIQSINYKKFRLLDSGFGDGSKIKTDLDVGLYLNSLLETSKVFFCISKFENLSTIFLTKGYNFFINYIQNDTLILNESIFKKEKATFPAKILELSFNSFESKTANELKVVSNEELNNENNSLKFSQNIYNNIKKTDEIIILNGMYKKGFLSKNEIESLFLEYDRKEIFAVFEMLSQTFQKKVEITLRHIKHLIKHKFYKDYASDNFFIEYIDTLSMIEQIMLEKQKVADKLKKSYNKLSKTVIESYNEFLKIRENIFFEIKTKKDLKNLHNKLSAIQAIFQDEELAEKYIDVAEKNCSYNDEIEYVKFLVIPTAHDIYQEHFIMNHCIQSYITNIVKEEYLAIRVLDKISNERATMGIKITNGVFCFNQLKGFKNSRATSFLIKIVNEYLKKHKIILNVQENNVDLQPDTSRIDRMDDYIEEDKVKELRSKLKIEQLSIS